MMVYSQKNKLFHMENPDICEYLTRYYQGSFLIWLPRNFLADMSKRVQPLYKELLLFLRLSLKFLFTCCWIKHKISHPVWTTNSMLKNKSMQKWAEVFAQSIFISQRQEMYITILHHKEITIVYLRYSQKKKM